MPKQGLFGMAGAIAALALVPYQGAPAQTLTELPVDHLRTEVRTRYDAALATSIDPAVVSADSNVHTWASEAKVQCGIALGFLKSGTKDDDSLRRCDFAYGMMTQTPKAAPPPPPPPPPPADSCPAEVAATFFFDWDSTAAPADAAQDVNFIAENRQRCGWAAFTVVGHTDRSGSTTYNDGLSVRRAHVIAEMMTAAGIPASIVDVSGRGEHDPRVATPDNERSPANRRVEVRVKDLGEQ